MNSLSNPDGFQRESSDDESKIADRMLQAAASLFRRKGYGAGTTRELSEALGIQKASLYYHIRSKEELLLAISIESLNRIIKSVTAARDAGEPDTRLERMIAAHVETALHDRDMHMTMLTELRSLSPKHRAEVLQLRDQYEAVIRDAITEEQEKDRLRVDIDSKYLTLALLNLLNWTIFWYDPSGPFSPAEIAAVLSTVYLNGANLPA